MLKKWKVKAKSDKDAADLAKKLNISTLLAGILISRGVDTKEKGELFLHPEKIAYCDPYLLPDMRQAVLFQDQVKVSVNKSGRKGLSVRPFENIIVFLIFCSK